MSKQVLINGVWQELADMAYDGLPVGFSLPFRGKVAPYGWLVEDGSTLQIATYPALFKAIGTTYGGDGVTTFKIPNSIGKYIRGGLADEVGTEVEAGLPNIEGQFFGNRLGITIYAEGAFESLPPTRVNQNYPSGMEPGSLDLPVCGFDASRSSSIYGNSDTVTPPTLVALPCIKAFDTIVETADVTTENLAAEIALRTTPDMAAHAAMPSDEYVDYPVPSANETTIIAPKDGYFTFRRNATTSTPSFIGLRNNNCGLMVSSFNHVGWSCQCFMPCKKGDTIAVSFVTSGAWNPSFDLLRFIPIVGAD